MDDQIRNYQQCIQENAIQQLILTDEEYYNCQNFRNPLNIKIRQLDRMTALYCSRVGRTNRSKIWLEKPKTSSCSEMLASVEHKRDANKKRTQSEQMQVYDFNEKIPKKIRGFVPENKVIDGRAVWNRQATHTQPSRNSKNKKKVGNIQIHYSAIKNHNMKSLSPKSDHKTKPKPTKKNKSLLPNLIYQKQQRSQLHYHLRNKLNDHPSHLQPFEFDAEDTLLQILGRTPKNIRYQLRSVRNPKF